MCENRPPERLEQVLVLENIVTLDLLACCLFVYGSKLLDLQFGFGQHLSQLCRERHSLLVERQHLAERHIALFQLIDDSRHALEIGFEGLDGLGFFLGNNKKANNSVELIALDADQSNLTVILPSAKTRMPFFSPAERSFSRRGIISPSADSSAVKPRSSTRSGFIAESFAVSRSS